ncbi:unnamed protein product [Hydatigera taeniaeformis]|uniref:Secreted protein n=1 Tax=Hydatigena taeniaeformis TaxID=6205 RepID=A0A0R3X4A9_HYDTA|nr:unnamed protein product [Hydatigera taeniaeformis]
MRSSLLSLSFLSIGKGGGHPPPMRFMWLWSRLTDPHIHREYEQCQGDLLPSCLLSPPEEATDHDRVFVEGECLHATVRCQSSDVSCVVVFSEKAVIKLSLMRDNLIPSDPGMASVRSLTRYLIALFCEEKRLVPQKPQNSIHGHCSDFIGDHFK